MKEEIHLSMGKSLSSLHAGQFFMLLLSSADFFQKNFLVAFFQEHFKSVKRFGSRSGPTLCLKSLSADDKSPLARKELKAACPGTVYNMISDGHDMTEKLLKVALSPKITIKTCENMLMSLAPIILI